MIDLPQMPDGILITPRETLPGQGELVIREMSFAHHHRPDGTCTEDVSSIEFGPHFDEEDAVDTTSLPVRLFWGVDIFPHSSR